MNWKSVGNYAKEGLYVIPIYGIKYHNKKPKEEKRKIGAIVAYTATGIFFIKYLILPSYILIKGVSTGNWHPFRFNEKEKIERTEQIIKKQSKLEKTVNYEKLLK